MNRQQVMSETFPFGIQRAWLDDSHIAMLQVSGQITDDARRVWDYLVTKTVQEWPEGRPVCLMQDLSQPDAFGPHAARAAALNTSLRDGQTAYSAIVIGDGTVRRLLSRVTRMRDLSSPVCHERVFATREAAYAWLRSVMTAQDTPAVAAV